LKKVRTAVFAGAATLVLAVPAIAQTPITFTPTGSVKTTGKGKSTAKKSKGVSAARAGFKADAADKKTIQEMRFFLPSTLKLSGKGFPSCSADQIGADPTSCPAGAQVGKGTATAVLGAAVPTTINFATALFNGGGNKLTLYVHATNPGLETIAAPIAATIKKAKKPYGQELVVPIPKSLQTPAAGLYSYITAVDTTINGKLKKGKKFYAQQFGCPKDKKHHFGVQLVAAANDAGPGGTSGIISTTSKCKA
jgi:hypothetical protein